MSLDPRHLIQLSVIAECGSFQLAAEQLGLAQSALSRNIKSLEERVGSAVLKRGRRGAIPTEIGVGLAQYGSVMRAAGNQALAMVTSVHSPRADHLRVGATQVISDNFLVAPLTEFISKRPTVSCSVISDNVDELLKHVVLGELDLAIGQFGVLTNSQDLHLEPLVEDQFTIIGRANHPLSKPERLTIDALTRAAWILPRREARLRRQIENALRYLGIHSIDVSYETSSMGMLTALVKKSDCLAMVPRLAISPLINEGEVSELSIDRTAPYRSIGILCQATRRKSAIVNSFCDDLFKFARNATSGNRNPRRAR